MRDVDDDVDRPVPPPWASRLEQEFADWLLLRMFAVVAIGVLVVGLGLLWLLQGRR